MEKKKRSLISWILLFLIIICMATSAFFIAKHFISLNEQNSNAEVALKDADDLIKKKGDLKNVQVGTVIGKIKVEGLTDEMPIIEGDDMALSLNHGVGHVTSTPFPGKGGQPAVSGHRETFFRPLKDAKKGDIVTVTMPYGTYTYEITHSIIVEPDKGNEVYNALTNEKERLILITCYPFNQLFPPNERIVFYAKLIS